MTHVRAATPDDASRIADINVRSWRDTYKGLVPDAYLLSLDPEAIARHLRQMTESGRDTVLVAGDPELLGFLWMSESRDGDARPGTAEIVALYVDPNHKRQGVGRALALASCEIARDRGFDTVSLWVFERNEHARAFYAALQFVPDGGAQTTTRWGGVALREVRYRRAIARS
jgi:ribosomal protein S18 acetylase RimI-like enzyme